MKKIALFLLILGPIFASIPKFAISNENRYNKCYRNPQKIDIFEIEDTRIPDKNYGWRIEKKEVKKEVDNFGWICETDGQICYWVGLIQNPTLLYCKNK